jgi:hypothetical protein
VSAYLKSQGVLMTATDEWTKAGVSILATESLEKIRRVLDEQPIIVEHRFFRSSSSPSRLIFDEYEDFFDYVKSQARAGDHFLIWAYSELCRNDNSVAHGKYPDGLGRVPLGGAY